MNRVVLVGRLARDPLELRRSAQNGTAVIRFTIAVDNRSKQEDKSADFIPCVAFNKSAEIVEQYFKKGMLVGVDGRIQTNSYEKDGQKIFTTEVVCDNVQILETKATSEERQSFVQSNPVKKEVSFPHTNIDIDEEELPF